MQYGRQLINPADADASSPPAVQYPAVSLLNSITCVHPDNKVKMVSLFSLRDIILSNILKISPIKSKKNEMHKSSLNILRNG